MGRHWLTGPLLAIAIGSAASSVADVLLAVVAPADDTVYIPQAIGNGVVALAIANIARAIPEQPGPRGSFAWARRSANVLALGLTLYALGWCRLAVGYLGERPLLLAATSVAAIGALLTAGSAAWAARRLPAGNAAVPVRRPEPVRQARNASKRSTFLVRAMVWSAAVCVLIVALACLVAGDAPMRVLGGFLFVAFVALARFLYLSRAKHDGPLIDRMTA